MSVPVLSMTTALISPMLSTISPPLIINPFLAAREIAAKLAGVELAIRAHGEATVKRIIPR